MDKVWEYSGQLFAYVIAGALFLLSTQVENWYRNKRSRFKDSRRGIEFDVKIREVLSELRAIFDADRVLLFQFKNGEYYYAGGSEQKLTLTHAVLKPGVSFPEAMLKTQDLPFSLLNGLVENLTQNSEIKFWPDRKNSKNCPMNQMFTLDGVKTLQMNRVEVKGRIVGIQMLMWLDKIPFVERPDESSYYNDLLGSLLEASLTRRRRLIDTITGGGGGGGGESGRD